MNEKQMTAMQHEPLDSVLYRATNSTQGIEALLMSDARYAVQLFFDAGTGVSILPDINDTDRPTQAIIHLWD